MSGYVLADDLSGALETGAVFRATGQRVILPLDPLAPARPEGGVEVISSETRGENAENAERIVRSIVTRRLAGGAKPVFKKIDSTMRGPIGAELRALIQQLAPPLIAFCPANPAAGRTVCDGKLMVRGVPLADSDFRNDPQWPATTSDIGSILESQGVSVGARALLTELRDSDTTLEARGLSSLGCPIVVFDAEADADLATIVEKVRNVSADGLFVGSAALAAAVAAGMSEGETLSAEAIFPRLGSLLVMCGSGHPASHRQLDVLESRTGVGIHRFWVGETSEEELAREVATSLEGSGIAAVKLDSRGGKNPDCARRIQETAGRLSQRIVDSVTPDSIFLTGGETAQTVSRALGGAWMEVFGELEPGVVLSRLWRGTRQPILMLTKPGGFGTEETILRVAGRR